MPLELNGTTGVQGNSGAFVAGTAVASTSGTSITFTSIPSWVKRVTMMFNGVSTDGSAAYQVQIGTSGGFVTSGYLGSTTGTTSSVGATNFTTGLGVTRANNTDPSVVINGIVTFVSIGSNIWAGTCTIGVSNTASNYYGGTSISLGGALTQIRITTTNGTDNFDAGTINILYE